MAITPKKFCDTTLATVYDGSMSNYQDIAILSVPTKHINISDFEFQWPKSGQFCDLPIIRQWK